MKILKIKQHSLKISKYTGSPHFSINCTLSGALYFCGKNIRECFEYLRKLSRGTLITEAEFLERYPKHEVFYNDNSINKDHFKTSDYFWDCNCSGVGKVYIRNKKKQPTCTKCGAREEDQPDSRINEILLFTRSILLTYQFNKKEKKESL